MRGLHPAEAAELRRLSPPDSLSATPVIAVLHARDESNYEHVVQILSAEGIRSIELAYSSPDTLSLLSRLRQAVAPSTQIGIGTVTTIAEAVDAIDAGAEFLVTPGTDAAIINCALYRGVRVYPGGFTPAELGTGWSLGATAVTLFPANIVGPDYIRLAQQQFAGMRVIPTGGVRVGEVCQWLAGGAVAVRLGVPLLGDALDGGDLDSLRQRAGALMASLHDLVEIL